MRSADTNEVYHASVRPEVDDFYYAKRVRCASMMISSDSICVLRDVYIPNDHLFSVRPCVLVLRMLRWTVYRTRGGTCRCSYSNTGDNNDRKITIFCSVREQEKGCEGWAELGEFSSNKNGNVYVLRAQFRHLRRFACPLSHRSSAPMGACFVAS